jgi:hypothetical protein
MGLQHECDGDHRIGEARPENGDEDERQEERRKGEDHVHDPHDHRVDPAAEEARDQAEQHAGRDGQDDDDDADEKRELGAVHQPRKDVAATGSVPSR